MLFYSAILSCETSLNKHSFATFFFKSKYWNTLIINLKLIFEGEGGNISRKVAFFIKIMVIFQNI